MEIYVCAVVYLFLLKKSRIFLMKQENNDAFPCV